MRLSLCSPNPNPKTLTSARPVLEAQVEGGARLAGGPTVDLDQQRRQHARGSHKVLQIENTLVSSGIAQTNRNSSNNSQHFNAPLVAFL